MEEHEDDDDEEEELDISSAVDPSKSYIFPASHCEADEEEKAENRRPRRCGATPRVRETPPPRAAAAAAAAAAARR